MERRKIDFRHFQPEFVAKLTTIERGGNRLYNPENVSDHTCLIAVLNPLRKGLVVWSSFKMYVLLLFWLMLNQNNSFNINWYLYQFCPADYWEILHIQRMNLRPNHNSKAIFLTNPLLISLDKGLLLVSKRYKAKSDVICCCEYEWPVFVFNYWPSSYFTFQMPQG